MQPILVGIDWGTSSLRAYLIGYGGRVIEARESGHGLRALPPGGFPAALAGATGNWPDELPVLMCGMVGSRSGWREAAYLDVSEGVSLSRLATALTPVETGDGRAWIVPGVRTGAGMPPDVMRGEETQVLGLSLPPEGTCVLPGTHSKWVRVADGRITGFRTAMTGEVFAALARHTILAETLTEPADPDEAAEGFSAGVGAARMLERPGDLLQQLFAIRAGVLLGAERAGRGRDFLSGLLIGAEILAEASGDPVRLIGSASLTERYARALDLLGIAHEAAPADAAVLGLHAIARAAGLIEGDTR